jgi:hypothetical protein
MGDTGLELSAKSPGKQEAVPHGGAKSGANASTEPRASSPELQEIIDAWAILPAAVMAGIIAIVRASRA